ncbi:MAG: hypothetical protein ACO3XO_02230 [Bdellovibrionota bacterium]
MAAQLKTCSIFLAREVFSDADGHWMAAAKVRKASQMNETLAMIWEQLQGGFALEIYSHLQHVELCFTAPAEQIPVISSALYTMIPTASILEREDCIPAVSEHDIVLSQEYSIAEPRYPVLPFLTYDDCQHDCAGPLLNILTVLPPEFKVIVQFVARALPETSSRAMWYKWQSFSWRSAFPLRPLYWFKPGIKEKFAKKYPPKILGLMFQVNLRASVVIPTSVEMSEEDLRALELRGKESLRSIAVGLSFINSSDMGRLKAKAIQPGQKTLVPFSERRLRKPFFMTTHELATIWHPVFVDKQMNIAQILASNGNPPSQIFSGPQSGSETSLFATTNFRQAKDIFGIRREDRASHLHVLGKSGTGKSKLLELLVQSDMEQGMGLALIDCHGDLVDDVLSIVPENRISDVAVFDISDYEYPPCFNPFASVMQSERQFFASEMIDMLKKVDSVSLSESGERYIHNSICSLLELPNTTIYDLYQFLKSERVRSRFIARLPEGNLADYWLKESETIESRRDEPGIFRIVKILSRLLSTNLIGCVLGQRENKFDFVRMMEDKKIVLIKVPKKNLGRQNTILLGTLLLTSLRLAAAARVSHSRSIDPFYIYIDEFQNFATDSFAKSIATASKQGVSYTIAHQMLNQLPVSVQDVLMAKVGNVISFQLGSSDALTIEPRFSPPFTHLGLMNLNLRNFYIRMMLEGAPQEPFSGRTLDVKRPMKTFSGECLDRSRRQYARGRSELLDSFDLRDSENRESLRSRRENRERA